MEILAQSHQPFDLLTNSPYNMNMREWSLRAGDPLNLTLAADMRFSTPNYVNDHIWEMELGSGEPPALSLRTTFGLRARAIRIFPRFTEAGTSIADVSEFAAPPVIRRCYPNFLELSFSPFEGLEVTYEVRVPESNAITGRVTIINRSTETRKPRLEMCAALVPLDGHAFSHTQMQMVNVLVGQTGGLVPLLFLTGGPLPGPGPQPSLMVDLDLGPGESRQLTWAQAATAEHQTSFDTARLVAAQPWDAERARIELVKLGKPSKSTPATRIGMRPWHSARMPPSACSSRPMTIYPIHPSFRCVGQTRAIPAKAMAVIIRLPGTANLLWRLITFLQCCLHRLIWHRAYCATSWLCKPKTARLMESPVWAASVDDIRPCPSWPAWPGTCTTPRKMMTFWQKFSPNY